MRLATFLVTLFLLTTAMTIHASETAPQGAPSSSSIPKNVATSQPALNCEIVRIGVLAFRPKEEVKQRWQPLADYLSKKIANEKFEIIPFNYTELETAVDNKSIDYIFTNSTHYVQLAFHTKLSAPLVTLINKRRGQSLEQFAGTIITLKDNHKINTLEDLKNRNIATPSMKSFGGFQMQAFELQQKRIFLPNDANIQQTTMPHDRAVFAVLNKQADAAFIRSGVLEAMAHQNKIALQDFKIINQQNHPAYPFLASTQLYPEWPLAAMPHIGPSLSAKVASALFALPHNGVEAQQMRIQGFRVAKDYEPVRDVLRELRIYPFDESSYIRMGDIWEQKSQQIVFASLLIITILLLFALNFRTYSKLKLSYRDLEYKNESLKLAAVAFETQESILITDAQQKIIKVNNAFTQTTGYRSSEVIGKTPKILSSGKHDKTFYQNIWQKLNSVGFWQGELWDQKKSGEIFPIHQTINVIKNEAAEVTHFVSTFHDISDLKHNQEEIKKLAFFDPLTSLANRRLLNDHLKMARAHSERSKLHFALLFIDLDHFKTLNDTLGHDTGDKVLVKVANRLNECVRTTDTVCRNGGDEFIILLEELAENYQESANKARLVAEKILKNLKKPMSFAQKNHYISASIGISLYQGHEATVEDMLVRSDLAMYKAKTAGRNAVQFFDPEMQASLKRQSQLISDMHRALQQQEFELYYQPKVNQKQQITGYEALIRWNHPDQGLLLPKDFIEAAEQSTLIAEMGSWVMQQACKQLTYWQQSPHTKDLSIAINISEKQLRDEHFSEKVFNTIKETKCNPRNLQMEITESLLMKNMQKTIETIDEIKTMGIRFAIDDFGTGYSSLGYLKNLPIDIIKIDYIFVKDMLQSQHDDAIVRTIMTLTKTFDIQAVAEGVETQEQLQHLIQLGCSELQGYLFGKPMPIKQLESSAQASDNAMT